VYENHNPRMRRERSVILRTLLTLLVVILFAGAGVYLFLRWETV
jgi:hypothetical protein